MRQRNVVRAGRPAAGEQGVRPPGERLPLRARQIDVVDREHGRGQAVPPEALGDGCGEGRFP